MHNVISKILLIIVVVLIALFAYKTMKTPNAVSATVSINTADQQLLEKKEAVEKIEQIVKEYLLKNPEVIIQSIEALQRRKMQEMEIKTGEYIRDNKSEIENSLTSPVLGDPNGDIIIAAFYDYNCGYCKKGSHFINQLIKSDKNVKVVLQLYPLLGDASNYAATIALAVYKTTPDKFQDIHNGLMELKPITKESVEKLLLENDLNLEIITKEINKGEIENLLDKNIKLAKGLRIQGVPAYIINGKLVAGMMDMEQLQKIIADIRSQNK
ncbi:DsbA family protein [Candidatus Tisiphia endosymbiont of Hybos culiciformis]|uniref:DsbA family protein n=1 Tax=Candidatus Tisiphia endosymbiont of Hybos culiciformis TaxID=3139331 RepID=UPI003CCB1CFA